VVIGLDGATFSLLKPWMAQGHLPYLKSLVAEGVSAPLRSCIPPVTVPAWQCFMTGKNPGKLGIAGFLRPTPNSYEEVPISAASCTARTLWELLSADGRRAAVLNVPYTVAPPEFNGILIGGFDTPPSKMHEAVYPPELLAAIEAKFGAYRIYLKMPQWMAPLTAVDRFEFAIAPFLQDCQEVADYQFQVAYDLLDGDDFDFVMLYQFVPDRIQHLLWYILDSSHPWHGGEATARFYEPILSYYRRLDGQIAELVRRVGGDPTVIVLSDHGFGPVTRGVDLNSWLLQEGYLHIKPGSASQLKLGLWRLGWGPLKLVPLLLKRPLGWKFVQRRILRSFDAQRPFHSWDAIGRVLNRLFLSTADIDWSRTKAYCLSEFGMLRINLQGREPRGAVNPQDYAMVRDEIVAKLRALVDPSTGRPVGGHVFTKEEVYRGKYMDLMPDLAYLPFAEGYLAMNPTTLLTRQIFIDHIGVSGFHRLDGVLIAKGPGIRAGVKLEGATLVDLAPTILYLMGSRVPDDMDGRVLTELFEKGVVEAHPVLHAEADPEVARPAMDLSSEDQEAVLNRLRGLGYVD
jgi:predicted AlkP superfamily phosphohydrolase/phosphomutase